MKTCHSACSVTTSCGSLPNLANFAKRRRRMLISENNVLHKPARINWQTKLTTPRKATQKTRVKKNKNVLMTSEAGSSSCSHAWIMVNLGRSSDSLDCLLPCRKMAAGRRDTEMVKKKGVEDEQSYAGYGSVLKSPQGPSPWKQKPNSKDRLEGRMNLDTSVWLRRTAGYIMWPSNLVLGGCSQQISTEHVSV